MLNKIYFYVVWISSFSLIVNGTLTALTDTSSSPRSRTDLGIPFIKNYSPKDYNAHQSNWAIVQDVHGIMYFGNDRGILEYDGVSWRLIQTPNRGTVRSLALGYDNRIYVGASGDFGYLTPDSQGSLEFVSLLPMIPDTNRDFGDVWQTIVTSEGIYFRTRKYLFRLFNNDIKVWQSETAYYSSFYVHERLYILQSKLAMMEVVSDTLMVAPLGEQFGSLYPYAMLPYDEDRILVGSAFNGLFLYDRDSLTPIPTSVGDLWRSHQLYHGIVLPDSIYAFSAIGKGMLLFDRKGNLIQLIDKRRGLPGDDIHYIYLDRDGVIWLALAEGISRNEHSSGFTVFDERNGLKGRVRDVTNYNGKLYAATSYGLFYLDNNLEITNEKKSEQSRQFIQVPGISVACWSMLEAGATLLIGSDHGVFALDAGGVNLLSMDQSQSLRLYRSRNDSLRIYVGLIDGLGIIRFSNERWNYEGKIAGVYEDIRRIEEETNGTVWLGSRYQGVLQLKPEAYNGDMSFEIERFDTTHGLPVMILNYPYRLPQGTRFISREGLHRFDVHTNRFEIDSSFTDIFPAGNSWISLLRMEGESTLWIRSGMEAGGISIARYDPGGLTLLDNAPFRRVESFTSNVNVIYPDDGIIWFGGADGLLRYDSKNYRVTNENYPAFIRQVSIEKDSVIFSGFQYGREETMTLPYEHNNIIFYFSAPSYYGEEGLYYQYKLVGFENDWSPWTQTTYREYTYLREGNYQFQVRARNIYGQESTVAAFDFRILPPWHRSLWAYIFYLAGLLAVGFGVLQLRVYQIRVKERRRSRERIRQIKELERTRQTERDHLRKKTSEDFHDELGHLITKISLFGELVKKKAPYDPDLVAYIQKIDQHTKSLSAGIKDFIWILNPERDSLYETLNRIKEFGETLCEYTDIVFQMSGISEKFNEIKLNPEVRRHLLMIFKEAMNNTLKYAQCSTIEFNASLNNDMLDVMFSDDGKGYDTHNHASGYGLHNMEERAKRIQGELSITSKPGCGTTVRLTVSMKALLPP